MAVSEVLSGSNLTVALHDALKAFPQATKQQKGGGADLSYGTLRFLGESRAYLQQLMDRPVNNVDIQSLLLVAIYQLLHDQADDFTVVNQAVQAAGKAKPRWAKGLVNGVLRNFLRKKHLLQSTIELDEVAQYSYPQWWIDKLKSQYPDMWQSILDIGNMHPPMTLRVNISKSSVKEYVQLLSRQDIQFTVLSDTAVKLEKPVSIERIPGFADGVVSVQDYGAQLAARALDLEPNMLVLDACSAPGGKAGHILELAKVALTALDSDAIRLERVVSNFSRLKVHATVALGDAAQWQGEHKFDRILADVPCSASGIVRRHVDIKWLRRAADVVSFTQQQALILANLWQLLSKGGKLLYVTCSIFAEENQQQIDCFLKQNPDAVQLPFDMADDGDKNIHIQHGQLIPSAIHDGFFYSLLQKT